jgi:hypothetical protein
MRIQMKIQGSFLNHVKNDLRRPHEYAYERIGFIFVNKAIINGEDTMLLPSYYMTIPDDQYIPDSKVGARYNADAIRSVMQRVFDTGEGAIHVHEHSPMFPAFSRDDIENQKRLIPTFRNVGLKSIHGAILLTGEIIAGLCWLPNENNPRKIAQIKVIERPLITY